MRRHTKLFRKVLIAALLTFALSSAGNSYSAHAQGAIAQPAPRRAIRRARRPAPPRT